MNIKHAANVTSILLATLLGISLSLQACAQTDDDGSDDPYANANQPMTALRMGEIILRIDENAVQDGPSWYFNVIGQVANVVASFGSSYSSGMFIFGGGDSSEIERKRFLEELQEQTI